MYMMSFCCSHIILPCPFLLIYLRVELRNQEDTEEEDDYIQRQTHLQEVGEAVAANTLHYQVCLIADGRTE